MFSLGLRITSVFNEIEYNDENELITGILNKIQEPIDYKTWNNKFVSELVNGVDCF